MGVFLFFIFLYVFFVFLAGVAAGASTLALRFLSSP